MKKLNKIFFLFILSLEFKTAKYDQFQLETTLSIYLDTKQTFMELLFFIGIVLAQSLQERCDAFSIPGRSCIPDVISSQINYEKLLNSYNFPILRDKKCNEGRCRAILYKNECEICRDAECVRKCEEKKANSKDLLEFIKSVVEAKNRDGISHQYDIISRMIEPRTVTVVSEKLSKKDRKISEEEESSNRKSKPKTKTVTVTSEQQSTATISKLENNDCSNSYPQGSNCSNLKCNNPNNQSNLVSNSQCTGNDCNKPSPEPKVVTVTQNETRIVTVEVPIRSIPPRVEPIPSRQPIIPPSSILPFQPPEIIQTSQIQNSSNSVIQPSTAVPNNSSIDPGIIISHIIKSIKDNIKLDPIKTKDQCLNECEKNDKCNGEIKCSKEESNSNIEVECKNCLNKGSKRKPGKVSDKKITKPDEESEVSETKSKSKKEEVVTVTRVVEKMKTVETPLILYREYTTTMIKEKPIVNYKVTTVTEEVFKTKERTVTTTETVITTVSSTQNSISKEKSVSVPKETQKPTEITVSPKNESSSIEAKPEMKILTVTKTITAREKPVQNESSIIKTVTVKNDDKTESQINTIKNETTTSTDSKSQSISVLVPISTSKQAEVSKLKNLYEELEKCRELKIEEAKNEEKISECRRRVQEYDNYKKTNQSTTVNSPAISISVQTVTETKISTLFAESASSSAITSTKNKSKVKKPTKSKTNVTDDEDEEQDPGVIIKTVKIPVTKTKSIIKTLTKTVKDRPASKMCKKNCAHKRFTIRNSKDGIGCDPKETCEDPEVKKAVDKIKRTRTIFNTIYSTMKKRNSESSEEISRTNNEESTYTKTVYV